MRTIHVGLAIACVGLSFLLRDQLSLFFRKPNAQIELKTQKEMVVPSKHALVVGASSGIGLGIAKNLAPIVAKLTLCSRSRPDDLLETIKTINPNVDVVHENLNVSSMHDVRKFTAKHARKHARTQFDYVVLTPGILTMNPRTETPEGLDIMMATNYYGRFMLVHDLLEGLNRPGVRVLNVLGAGKGGEIDVNDLDLKQAYSGMRCVAATTQYSDLAAQAFSEHAPNAAFLHAAPGFVNTGIAKNLPWYLHGPLSVFAAIGARSPDTCGKYMVEALINEDYAKG